MPINSDGPQRETQSKPQANGHVTPSAGSNEEPKFMPNTTQSMASAPKPPKFESKLQEREWLKFRLAQGI